MFFILLAPKITIAVAWKRPSVSLQWVKHKSCIMFHEKVVCIINDKQCQFEQIWEPWAVCTNVSITSSQATVSPCNWGPRVLSLFCSAFYPFFSLLLSLLFLFTSYLYDYDAADCWTPEEFLIFLLSCFTLFCFLEITLCIMKLWSHGWVYFYVWDPWR